MKLIVCLLSCLISINAFAQHSNLNWLEIQPYSFKEFKVFMPVLLNGIFVHQAPTEKTPEKYIVRTKLSKEYSNHNEDGIVCYGTYQNELGEKKWALCSLKPMNVSSCSEVKVKECINDQWIEEDHLKIGFNLKNTANPYQVKIESPLVNQSHSKSPIVLANEPSEDTEKSSAANFAI